MPAGSVWGRSHLERGTRRYNGNEQKHMPVNAVMPNPLRQPRATMSLLVPLSSALGLPRKCLVWPPLTFFLFWVEAGGSEKIYLSVRRRKIDKAREHNCFRVPLSCVKIVPGSLSPFLHSQRLKSFKGERDQEKKRIFKKKGGQWNMNEWS